MKSRHARIVGIKSAIVDGALDSTHPGWRRTSKENQDRMVKQAREFLDAAMQVAERHAYRLTARKPTNLQKSAGSYGYSACGFLLDDDKVVADVWDDAWFVAPEWKDLP